MRTVHGRLAALSALVVAATGLVIAGVSAVAQAGCDKDREISVTDVAAAEGTAPEDAPVTWFTVKVTSAGCAVPGTVEFTTIHETTDEKDLRAVSGKLVFDEGDMSSKEISVAVYADADAEEWEKFVVLLHSPTSKVSATRQATRTGQVAAIGQISFCKDFALATIANDDGDARGKKIIFPTMEPRCELHKSR